MFIHFYFENLFILGRIKDNFKNVNVKNECERILKPLNKIVRKYRFGEVFVFVHNYLF